MKYLAKMCFLNLTKSLHTNINNRYYINCVKIFCITFTLLSPAITRADLSLPDIFKSNLNQFDPAFDQDDDDDLPKIEAEIITEESPFGRSYLLEVKITREAGKTSGEPNMPQTRGLSFERIGKSSGSRFFFQSINGKSRKRNITSETYTYKIHVQQAGKFRIAPIQVEIEGKNYQSRTLELDASGAQKTQIPKNPQHSPNTAQTTTSESSSVAFLEIVADRRKLYVGEKLPIKVNLYVREGLNGNITKSPKIKGSAFIFDKVRENPTRQRIEKVGVVYTRITWDATLSPIKAGKSELVAELPMEIAIPTRSSRQKRRRQNLFNDPFFDNFFNDNFMQRYRYENLDLLSENDISIEVENVPAKDKPADYCGAIGNFHIDNVITPKEVNAGEPFDIKVVVSGNGNFDRLNDFKLETNARQDWQIYNQKSEFKTRYGSELVGAKFFTITMAAKNPRSKRSPRLALSYFNPETKTYERLPVESRNILVRNPQNLSLPAVNDAPATQNDSQKITQEDTTKADSENGKISRNAKKKTQTSSSSKKEFTDFLPKLGKRENLLKIALLCALALAIAISPFIFNLWQKVKNSDTHKLKHKETILRNKLQKAIRKEDASAFFAELKALIRLKAARKSGEMKLLASASAREISAVFTKSSPEFEQYKFAENFAYNPKKINLDGAELNAIYQKI